MQENDQGGPSEMYVRISGLEGDDINAFTELMGRYQEEDREGVEGTLKTSSDVVQGLYKDITSNPDGSPRDMEEVISDYHRAVRARATEAVGRLDEWARLIEQNRKEQQS